MFLIILCVYLLHTFSSAAPLPAHHTAETFQQLMPRLPMCVSSDEQRTVWEILWSCVVTAFTCTWVSVHPNIPDSDDSTWTMAKNRAGLMIWTILAPELVIVWAIRQWIGARKIANQYHKFGWTKTHGYFLQMGGFMLYALDGNTRERVLFESDLENLVQSGMIEVPGISKDEIHDRSKSDGFTKIIAVFQTTWFVVQCICRHTQGLVVTELEVVTLAFAMLNGLVYFLWWNKPMAVRFSVPVFLHQSLDNGSLAEENQPDPSRPGFSESTEQSNGNQESSARLPATKYQYHPKKISSPLMPSKSFDNTTKTPRERVIPLPFMLLETVNEALGASFQVTPTNESLFRVGTYHAHYIPGDRHFYVLSFLAVVVGNLIAAIHLTVWTSPFPSNAERIIWHVCSLVLMSVPNFLFLVLVLTDLSRTALPQCRYTKWASSILLKLVQHIRSIAILLYIIARLVLTFESFISLRALTPAALTRMEWTSFIPHI